MACFEELFCCLFQNNTNELARTSFSQENGYKPVCLSLLNALLESKIFSEIKRLEKLYLTREESCLLKHLRKSFKQVLIMLQEVSEGLFGQRSS